MIVLLFIFISMMKVIGNKNGKKPVTKTYMFCSLLRNLLKVLD